MAAETDAGGVATPPAGASESSGEVGAFSIRSRVVLFAVVMVLLMLAVAVPSVIAAERQNARVTRLTAVAGPATDINRRVVTTAHGVHDVISGAVGHGASHRDRIDADLASIDRDLASIDRIMTAERYDRGAVVDPAQVRASQAKQRAAAATWQARVRAVQKDGSPYGRVETGDFERLVAANDEIAAALDTERVTLQMQLSGGEQTQTRNILAASAAALAIAIVATWWTLRLLTAPVLALHDAVRRQREGHRSVWADTTSGAREVRELAADVNALTASHLALLDEQAVRLDYERAMRELTKMLRETYARSDALERTAESLAVHLRVGHVVAVSRSEALVDRVDEEDSLDVGQWVAEGHSGCPQDDRALRHGFIDRASQMVAEGQRLLRVDDLSEIEPGSVIAHALPGHRDYLHGSLLVVAVSLRGRVLGALVLHDPRPRRPWTTADLAFVDGTADVLAQFCLRHEAEQRREKYIRQLEELDRHKDTFLSTVTHELRTPLTSISGYLEMLTDGDGGELTPEQRDMVEVIDRNATRLRALIEDLLVLGRVQRDTAASTRELVDIGEIVRHVVAEHRTAAERLQVDLRGTVGDGLLVLGDRGTLTRALSNVVGNAVKFSPDGGDVELSVRVDAATVDLVCADTGMGIPAADSAHIGERFYRAANAAAAHIPGTGLGLALVKGIVESHGGHLSLASTESVGTTVTLTLPLAQPLS